ncbi:MAG TPA: TonB-dependent siderophore receptor [Ensifer sp.]|nr:TonB-dependent siderophore receptor [Ensifer sp.]
MDLAAAQDAATKLNRISVTAKDDNDPAKTTVVTQSESGTKTDTPILQTSAAISVVTQKELEKRKVQSLQQAVSYTAGVSTDEFGSDDRYDYVRIRGFDQTALGTYRDGLPARIPAWFTAARLEPYGLEKVEILKGSRSSLFGLNGPGGLVNAVTKKPKSEPFHEVYTTFGSNGHVETGLDIGGAFDKDGVWTYRLTAKGQLSDNGYAYSKDNRFYIAPALTISPDADTTLTFLTNYSKRDGMPARGIPANANIDVYTFLGEPAYNKFNTTQADVGYEFEHRFDDGLQFRQKARYSYVKLDYQEVYGASTDPTANRTAFGVDGSSNRFAIDNQLEYDGTIKGAESKFLIGLDATHDNTRENIVSGTAGPLDINNPVYCGLSCINVSTYTNWRVIQKAIGLYAQEELTLFDKLILTGGLRFDHVNTKAYYVDSGTYDDNTENALTKRVGASYLLTDSLAAYANYSESFQPLVAPTANGYAITGGLKAQRGTQYEVGLKYRPDSFNGLFTLAFFDLTQTNVPSWDGGYTVQRQIGKVRVRGIELEGKFEIADHWNATLAYSYWDGKIVGDGNSALVGNTPERVPQHIASAWLDYTLPGDDERGDLTVGGGVRFIGATYGDSANTVKVPAYAVFDAMVSYKLTKNLTLAINASNIFDRKYVATNYYGTNYYGDRRTVLGTLKYTW